MADTLTSADELADVVLPDQDGNEVRLGDLWRDGPVALVWLRHYGWVFCQHHAVQLDGARDEIEAAGAKLVFVGQATPRQAAHFRRRRHISAPVLADENRSTYKIAGAKKGSTGDLIGPKVVAKGAMVTARTGILQTRTIGNAAQLGGAMVIAPDGSVVWSRMAKDASDNASAKDIIAAAQRARQPAG